MTTTADADIAQTAMITWTVLLVALVAIVMFVALGVYRARHSAAREAQYRALAGQVGEAQTQIAASIRTTADELTTVRTELQATRAELTQVGQRLAELERLLNQIG